MKKYLFNPLAFTAGFAVSIYGIAFWMHLKLVIPWYFGIPGFFIAALFINYLLVKDGK